MGVLTRGGALIAEDGHVRLPIAARVRALEDQVIAAGLSTDDELDAILTGAFKDTSPVSGARIVARAWTDRAYRERLLADGSAAAAELGFQTLRSGAADFRLRVRGEHSGPAQHDRLHPLPVLSDLATRAVAELVQEPGLPVARGA
ncbi:MAG: nitrile hydratase subunit alpha [Streptosporangiaceae bacterium]